MFNIIQDLANYNQKLVRLKNNLNILINLRDKRNLYSKQLQMTVREGSTTFHDPRTFYVDIPITDEVIDVSIDSLINEIEDLDSKIHELTIELKAILNQRVD